MRTKLPIAAFAALAIASSLWGCSSGPNATKAAIPFGEAPVLGEARIKDAVNLDPAQATEGMSLNVTTEIMKGLVQFRVGTFDVEPAIADSWALAPDGRHWTFHLKHGLTFSDGTPVDAQAVKFNFDRWRLLSDPYHGNFEYPYYNAIFGGFPGLIRDVSAPAPDTVVFALARPFAPFLHDLALPNFAIASPAALRRDLAGFSQHPVGWGPYVLVEWVKNQRITLRSNPAYPVAPFYRTVVVRDIPDQATSLQLMRSGDVDVFVEPRPEDAALLQRTVGVTVYYEPANNNAYLAMNMDKHPFDVLAVRQAIAYGIDTRSIVRQYYPTGAEAAANWTPPGMMGDDPAAAPYPYDPKRARALLAAAGFRKGFSTELYYSTIPRPYLPEPEKVAREIRRQLAAIGVRVRLSPFEWSVFLQKVHGGEHRMALAGWSGDNGDPDNFLYTLLDKDSAHRPNALNYSFWRDERFHQLMLAGQATVDPAQRAAIYRQANAMVHDFVPSIPIVHVTVPVAVRTSIAGFVPCPDTRIPWEYLHPMGS